MKLVKGVKVITIFGIILTITTDFSQGQGNGSVPIPQLFTIPPVHDTALKSGPNDDIMIKYGNKNTSFLELAGRLNARFGKKFLEGCKLHSSRSCQRRCDKRERNETLQCYCDEICQDFGDCCYDYYSRCIKSHSRKKPKYSCFDPKSTFNSGDWGFIVVSSCPAFINHSSQLARACVQPHPTDIFQQLPVFDKKTNISYRNYFCARCNQVVDIAFWKGRLECLNIAVHPDAKFNLTFFIKHSCFLPWKFSPPLNVIRERCILRKHRGWCSGGNSNKNVNWKMVKSLCEAYYLPVCKQESFSSFGTRYNNPHCLLCGHHSTSPFVDWHCLICPGYHLSIFPGMQVLFDFSSTSQFKVNVGYQKTVVVKTERCSQRQVYDPFSRSCREVPAFQDSLVAMQSETPLKSSTSNTTHIQKCVGALFKANEIRFLANGSVFIIPHGRVYPKTLYASNGSELILCTNFSANNIINITTIKNITTVMGRENVHSFAFGLITFIGGSLSVVSLIILVAVYVRIKETRKLPGKITICLCCTLLVFHLVFFFTGFTDLPALCSAMAVVLQYLLLSFFTWMNVLAANMAYTFVTMEYRAAALPRLDSEIKRFIKCCCHGWITPLVWVGVCVALEYSQAVNIGYGKIKGGRRICWISNEKALLYVVCLPVAFILVFNLVALVLCIVTIGRTRKNTRQVSKDSKSLDLPVLTLKLIVIFGLTWALGFVAASERTAFIWYPFVILSSLQGVLLFVALKGHSKLYQLLKSSGTSKYTSGPYTKSSKDEPIQLKRF